jgi:putative ABC transport system permease protein
MTSEAGTIVIRIASDNIMHTMNLLKNKWKELVPHHIFDYYFLDESFDSQYRAEEKMGTLTLYFSILAIFIGCLGLFGMSSYIAEQRKREIGIRKVLGASVPGIMKLISGELMILMGIACIIAWPAAYFIMSKWLLNFAYRTNIGLWTFMISGTLALVIALVTVSYQSVKAAIANPVEALRYE